MPLSVSASAAAPAPTVGALIPCHRSAQALLIATMTKSLVRTLFGPHRVQSIDVSLTGKYPQGEWVGEVPGGACGAGCVLCRCGFGSGGGFEGDAVAHRHQLRDVVACSAFGVDPGGVVVGAEVGVAGGGVVEQVPDDDQDRAGASDA